MRVPEVSASDILIWLIITITQSYEKSRTIGESLKEEYSFLT